MAMRPRGREGATRSTEKVRRALGWRRFANVSEKSPENDFRGRNARNTQCAHFALGESLIEAGFTPHVSAFIFVTRAVWLEQSWKAYEHPARGLLFLPTSFKSLCGAVADGSE
ncbi:protein of unknown function [Cupriavidus taiwanensis]|nr:protein of unknown function [Cupriavidus taiwanensis]